ncbi:MAG: efflux RND transporter periplasmic adaptor subunit [Gammaproteobacteria bacterium]|nr:efflux RND transporter periplasmic adaptor subunit [Gammaproteobacteria bacterium]MCI0590410.1 efflux RND transporter periplasmic adaptor subunit [Gammaproteobacteria bacterium]
MHKTKFWVFLASVLLASSGVTEEIHNQGDELTKHTVGMLKLDSAEREAAGVITTSIQRLVLTNEIIAPGEVYLNAYRTAKVTPRIAAQVIERRVKLGDDVKRDQPLVLLSSVEMAKAQGDLLVAEREWMRVENLGKEVVSERRFVEAKAARQLARAKVLAFGMTPKQVAALLRDETGALADGRFELLAPIDGTVISDGFIVGEIIEPGRGLFEITDESVMWVEARLPPEDARQVTSGTLAGIGVGDRWLEGTVAKVHHGLDETTRTIAIRIEVKNRGDVLHREQFVEVRLQVSTGEKVIAVPSEAIVLLNGTPTLFTVEGDEVRPQSVEVGAIRGDWTEIIAGLSAGDEVVVKGAYFVKSLILKSELGEGHVQ